MNNFNMLSLLGLTHEKTCLYFSYLNNDLRLSPILDSTIKGVKHKYNNLLVNKLVSIILNLNI